MQLSQKPKSLFCYVCGREFGTTSLAIHLKSCLKKFQIEQSKKQSKDRIKLPQPPQELQQILSGSLDSALIQKYNQKAINCHKYSVLAKCRFCSRTFNEESLKAHENGCSKKGNQKVQDKSSHVYSFPQAFKKPRTLTCCVCGRDFGLTSLKIHYPQCIQKFKDDQSKKPKADRRQPPKFSEEQLQMINNKQDWTVQEIDAFNNNANGNYRDNAMVQCPNCGRKFLQTSFQKHKKNCALINGDKSGENESKSKASLSKQPNFRATSSQFRKPRTLSCCVCGRQFGLTSLKIHYPQCLEKFKIQQNKKQKSDRRVPPQFSKEQLQMINNKQDWTIEQIQQFNNKAIGSYRDKGMVECPNCGRKFFEQSYQKHKKNCTLINGVKNPELKQKTSSSVQNNLRPNSPEFKKPRTLTCCVCGRQFGLTSLKIHYPQCLQKFIKQEKKKPKQQRKNPPQFSQQQLQKINNKEDWTLQEIDAFNNRANEDYRDKAMVQCPNCGRKFLQTSYQKHKKNCVLINGQNKAIDNQPKDVQQNKNQSAQQLKKPKVLMCHICGREFGLTSLTIHHPKCKQKFQNQQKKKQKQQRRVAPAFPQDQLQRFDLQNALNWPIQKIQEYNKIANQVYRAQSLCPCPICGRKFFQQSLPKHLKFCEKNKQKQGVSEQKSKIGDMPSPKNLKMNRKNSALGKNPIKVEKIQQQQKQQSFKNSPNQKKSTIQNQSFLKKSLYKKIQNSPQTGEGDPGYIPQVDQSLQQTFKATKQMNDQVDHLKQVESQPQTQIKTNIQAKVEQQSKQNEIAQQQKQQNQFLLQKQSDKISKQIEQPKVKSQMANMANSKTDQVKLGTKQINSNSQSVKKCQTLNKSISSRPQSRNSQKSQNKSVLAKANKKKLQQSKLNQSHLTQSKLDSSKLDQSLQKSTKMQQSALVDEKKQPTQNKRMPKDVKQLNIQQNQKSKQDKNDQARKSVLSPVDKIRQGKGFAAPRKKQQAIKASMKQCKICNRKFDQDRLQKHEKLCLQNKERQRKSERNIQNIQQISNLVQKPQQKNDQSKQKVSQRDILSPEDKIRLKKGFAAPRQKQSQIEAHMAECRGCKRKFTKDRIQKHQGICKQAQEQIKQPFVAGSYKKNQQNNEQDQRISIKRVPCPKCNRKFLQERIQKHLQVCKVNSTLNIKQQINKNRYPKQKQNSLSSNVKEQKSYKIDDQKVEAEKQAAQNINLQKCEKCGRKFMSQRISKHLQVCKGVNSLQAEPNKTKTDFRKQKDPLPPTKQYNLDKIEVKQQSQPDMRVECPKCFRKFAPDRLQKHINNCKSVPPLNANETKGGILKKQLNNPAEQRPNTKLSVQSPKTQEKILKTIGDDQYVETQLVKCQKCSRKFVSERLQKHMQICKGANKLGEKPQKNVTIQKPKIVNQQQIRKTKNQFFNMVKDLKTKMVKQQELQKQIDSQLQQIQATNRSNKKQNINRSNSEKKRVKQAINKSIVLPKI